MITSLNICMFSRVNFWQGIKGGMDFHGKVLSEGLVRKGHKVTIISSRHPEGILRDHKNGVDIHYLPDTVFGSRRHGWAAKSVKKFYELHHQTPFDLIWSQSFDAFGFAKIKNTNIFPPIVATLHGCVAQEMTSFFSNTRKNIKSPLKFIKGLAGLVFAYFICQKPLLSVADRVICVSPVVAKDIGKWFGSRYEEKCTIIENGIDVDFFKADPEKGRRIRQQLGVTDDEHLILSLGRLTYAKGHHVAIDALKMFADQKIKAKVIIAGDGESLESLKNMARQSGLSNRVIFTGFVSHDDAVGLYNAADIFVMPTMTIEGLPFVILEAMACGTPVIASDIGGIKYVITDSINGLLIGPGKTSELFEKMVELINDDKLRLYLAKQGQKTVIEKYSLNRMITDTLAAMTSAVSGGIPL